MPSDYEDQLAEMYPTAEARETRRAKLFERIDAFLDAGYIESGPGGGWAPIEREQENEFREIFDEIIDLKVGRDADGDRTILAYIDNRRRGRLETIHVPYIHRGSTDEDREPTHLDELEKISELQRAGRYAQSLADNIIRDAQIAVEEMVRAERIVVERNAAVEAFSTRLDVDEFETFASDWFSYLETIKINIFEDEKIAAVQAQIVAKYPEKLEAAIEQTIWRLSKFESDDDDGYYDLIVVPMRKNGKVFGRAFTRNPGIDAVHKPLNVKGREIRAEKRARAAALREKKS